MHRVAYEKVQTVVDGIVAGKIYNDIALAIIDALLEKIVRRVVGISNVERNF